MAKWEEIDKKLDTKINEIFENKALYALSPYERRKTIFEYLCNNLTYDYELLDKIKDVEINKQKLPRNPHQELMSVMDNNNGICNAISQYYKLLLEKVGIKSHCVVCDDLTEVNHQMLIVYNEETSTYSFDDVTSVIVGRGTKEEYFDYDLDKARFYGQGQRILITDQYFTILPEEYIDYVTNRPQGKYQTLDKLPANISSVKKQVSTK